MTKQHINETELEKLARLIAEGKLGLATNEHLQTCEVCSKKLEFLTKFHTSLAEELPKQLDERVKQFVEKLTSPNIIRFKPFYPQPNYESIGIGENNYVLAAQTVAEDVVRYKTSATFASEHVHALVRINEDTEQKLYQIYVLSEFEDHRNHILISIAEADGEMFFIPTNKDGFAELQYSNPINWRTATLVLMTPNKIFPFNMKSEQNILEGLNSITPPYHMLFVYEDHTSYYKFIEIPFLKLPADTDTKIVEIRIFASVSQLTNK